MPLFRVEANCPIEEYEGENKFDAIEKYSENYHINYKFLTAEEIEYAPQDIVE